MLFLLDQRGQLGRPKGDLTWSGDHPRPQTSPGTRASRKAGGSHGNTPKSAPSNLDRWRHYKSTSNHPGRLDRSAIHPRSLSGPKNSTVKVSRTKLIKHPGIVKLKRRLFHEGMEVKRILFMNADIEPTSDGSKTKLRLPNGTWVGIRCPWEAMVCPLCDVYLTSLGAATIHFKKRHTAQKLIYLCANCGTSGNSSISLALHTARCGSVKRKPTSGGSHGCEHCSRSFLTKRGLTQHV